MFKKRVILGIVLAIVEGLLLSHQTRATEIIED